MARLLGWSLSTLLLFHSFWAHAEESFVQFEVEQIREVDGPEGLELLGHNPEFASIVLDCHSFVQGINLTPRSSSAPALHFYMEYWECHHLEELLYKAHQEQVGQCVTLFEKPRKIRLSPLDDCRTTRLHKP
jgi:hypothetical protein